MNTEQRPRLERWLHMFSSTTLAQHPDLLLAGAWIAQLGRADTRTVLDLVGQAQALVDQMTGQPERARQLQGEIDTLHSIEMSFASNDPQGVIALATRALETLPQTWYLARVEAWLQLALGYQMSGQLNRSYAVLAAAQTEDSADIAGPRARLWGSRCFIHWMAADLPGLLESAHRTVSAGQATDRQIESLGWGHYFLAIGYYQRNDLAAAELHANAVQEQRHACHRLSVLHSAIVLAEIQQARGRPDEARLALDWESDYLVETRNEALQRLVQAFAAELAAVQGDLDTAGRWATTVGTEIPLGGMGFFYAPQLTLPKVLLAMNTSASRQQASEALSRLYDFVTTTHNTRFTIEVLALQALLEDAQGDERAALALLEQAVLMAEPGGFIRLFADLGPRMAGLLARLQRTGVAPRYTGQILQALGEYTPVAPNRSAAVSVAGRPELVEPLTEREREVLALLAQRMSNKEIAQDLTISPQTVKRHATNIYQKLQAGGRREAVAKAIRLGLV